LYNVLKFTSEESAKSFLSLPHSQLLKQQIYLIFRAKFVYDFTALSEIKSVDLSITPILDYKNSYVHGFVHNGVFEGKVKLSDKLDDEFHIEPSSDHFKTKKEYHSVIYKASDLHYPHSYGKDLDLSEKTRKWIEESRRLPKENFDGSERMVPRVPHRYRRSTEDKVICQIHLRVSYEFC
jgi:hypothetical protein